MECHQGLSSGGKYQAGEKKRLIVKYECKTAASIMNLLEYDEHISVQAGCLEDRNKIFGIIGYPRLSNL